MVRFLRGPQLGRVVVPFIGSNGLSISHFMSQNLKNVTQLALYSFTVVGCYSGLWVQLKGRRPSLLQQRLKISIAQRPELVDETDAGKELRVPRESLFDSRHADEYHAQAILIEDGATRV